MQIANEILRQLGGAGRLKAMINGKDYVGLPAGLQFGFMRAKNGINKVRIELNANDLYDVQFYKIRGADFKIMAEVKGLYFDMLAGAFWDHAGLALKL